MIATVFAFTAPAVGTVEETGWTTQLVRGLMRYLAAGGAGVYHRGRYLSGETGIYDRAVPQEGKAITLAPYPLTSGDPGKADHQTAVQVRVRGGVTATSCDDIADKVFELLDGAKGRTFGRVKVVQIWRQSYTSLGQDGNNRWERSENYYLDTMRPTANNTD